jgi:hypothetical protein
VRVVYVVEERIGLEIEVEEKLVRVAIRTWCLLKDLYSEIMLHQRRSST